MGYINDDIVDTANGLPYKCIHDDKETIDENEYVIRMAKTILTAFLKMLVMPCGAAFLTWLKERNGK